MNQTSEALDQRAEGTAPAERSALHTRRDSLYTSLEEGYDRIAQGLERGEDVTKWEDLWLHLLNEYDAVCEQLQRDLAV